MFTRVIRLVAGVGVVTMAKGFGSVHDRLMVEGLKVLHPIDRTEIAKEMVYDVLKSRSQVRTALQ